MSYLVRKPIFLFIFHVLGEGGGGGEVTHPSHTSYSGQLPLALPEELLCSVFVACGQNVTQQKCKK